MSETSKPMPCGIEEVAFKETRIVCGACEQEYGALRGHRCVPVTRAEFNALKADLATVAAYLAKVDIRYVDGLPIKQRAALTRIASEGK